ncbi:DNA cytosine methyltransferase [Bordetella bronchiseptica]
MDDQRHLWPYWFHLIEQRRPAVVFGEQVEAAIRYGWLDLVQADMEGIDYAFAAAGIPAAGVGAPHIRQRLFFVADAVQSGWPERRAFARNGQATGRGVAGGLADPRGLGRIGRPDSGRPIDEVPAERKQDSTDPERGGARRLDDAHDTRLEGFGGGHQAEEERGGAFRSTATAGESRGLVNTVRRGLEERDSGHATDGRALSAVGTTVRGGAGAAGPTNGFWHAADWLLCRDGKWRPVEPGTFPLAHGVAARVGRLRAYGNAICAPLAAEFVSAFLECRP